jgi:cbb3-type cytochrome oxidase subunit 3
VSLTDIMSSMDLAVWPMAALVIFVGVFAAIMFRSFKRGSADVHRRAAQLPLSDDGLPE